MLTIQQYFLQNYSFRKTDRYKIDIKYSQMVRMRDFTSIFIREWAMSKLGQSNLPSASMFSDRKNMNSGGIYSQHCQRQQRAHNFLFGKINWEKNNA